jgi:hypothetical protein
VDTAWTGDTRKKDAADVLAHRHHPDLSAQESDGCYSRLTSEFNAWENQTKTYEQVAQDVSYNYLTIIHNAMTTYNDSREAGQDENTASLAANDSLVQGCDQNPFP